MAIVITTTYFYRFDISQSRIKSLQSWRNKKGPFKTLEDVLEVDGLGVKVFERLCESIVVDDGTKTENQNKLSNTTKNRRQLLIPAFNSYQADVCIFRIVLLIL